MNVNLIIRNEGDSQTIEITDDENDGAGPIAVVPFGSFAQVFSIAEQLLDSGTAETLAVFAPSASVADRWATLINADGSLRATVDGDIIAVSALIAQQGLPKPTTPCRVCGGDGWLDEVVDDPGSTGAPTSVCPYCNGTGRDAGR